MSDVIVSPAQSTGQEAETTNRTVVGFWIYLMTDCVLFASLFAVFAVLRNNTFGGPSGRELFNMPAVLAETLILLTSSFTCGVGILAARRGQKTQVFLWLGLTLVLGLAFLGLELSEFRHLVAEGNSWRRSGFLSAFFTLVATHGLHITVGLLWLVALLTRVGQRGVQGAATVRRLTLFSLFWHFLDVIWIFIFSIVYLLGVA